MKSIYTEPKLAKYETTEKDWFIWFRYNGKLKPIKRGLNYIKDYKERLKAFNELLKVVKQRLKEGWNPFDESLDFYNSDMKIVEAVKYGLDKKKLTLAPRTYESYATAANYFIDGIKAMHLDQLKIVDVKRYHCKRIIEKTKVIKGWSNKSYNKNKGYISAIFGELVEWDIIETSPFVKIRKKKEPQTEANIVATDKEDDLIKKELLDKFPPFFNYLATMFHTGIRPYELKCIQLHMIELENDIIRLPPEITKTDQYRRVTINPHLKDILLAMRVKDFPQEHYLFGSKREHFNRPISPETDFVPGPNRLQRSTATTLWKKLVKKGLGLDVNMYSYKHLGADKKILAGIELDALKELFGHNSKLMTKKYARAVQQVYSQQIKDKSPGF